MKKLFQQLIVILIYGCIFSFTACSDNDNTSQPITEETVSVTELKYTDALVHRINFNYTSSDIDGKTPVRLSGAIYIRDEFYAKQADANGFILLNHYTITDNAECPSENTLTQSMEVILAKMPYILVAVDNIGFGLTKDRPQAYMMGEVTARNSIDGLVAARNLLKKDGYKIGESLINMGYSQGGHTGMWVSRLVEEGYRSDEVGRINYSILGGGPYDTMGFYEEMVATRHTRYPVALPLMLYGVIKAGGTGLSVKDVFVPELADKLPKWFDSKSLETLDINKLIYLTVGGNEEDGVSLDKIMIADVLNPESELMQKFLPLFKDNSLVGDKWIPTKTDKVALLHSTNDEIVPFQCMEKMRDHLAANGYTHLICNTESTLMHTPTAMLYLIFASKLLTQNS